MSASAVLVLLAGFAGLAVLGAMGVRLYHQVRSLGATVARSSQRLQEVGGPPPLRESAEAGPPKVE